MARRRRMTVTIAVLAILFVMVGACSSEPPGGGGHGLNGDDNQINEEECDEGETRHPVHEECVADNDTTDNDGEDNDGEDNDGENNSSTTPPDECGPGAIEGQACRPDGELLPSAEVTIEGIDCDGESFTETTTTDEEGVYDFDGVPAGEHELSIESGSFETTQPVLVEEGETTHLKDEAAKICLQDSEISIAVIEGTYDDVSSILDDLDVTYDVEGADSATGSQQTVDEAAALLGDTAVMEDYDIIFIECGTLWTDFEDSLVDVQAVTDNIRDYVEAGNSIYASDQAHPFIQLSLPEAIDFFDEDPDNPSISWAGEGTAFTGEPLVADVVSSELQTALGMNTIELELMGGWAVAVDVGGESTVHFEADAQAGLGETVYDAPMMVHYEDPGTVGGTAVFTSFHNAEQAEDEIQEVMEYMIFQL